MENFGTKVAIDGDPGAWRQAAGLRKKKIVICLDLDRTDAGQHLAARLTHYADRSDVLVLALPRGGMPVAFEVAKQLGALCQGCVRGLSPDTIALLQSRGHSFTAIGSQGVVYNVKEDMSSSSPR